MLSCRPLPGPGLGDGGQRCGRAGSEAACERSLAAAYIEHPGEAFGDEAPGDQLVNVPCHGVAAKHRAREAQAAGVLVVVGGDRLGWLLPGVGIVVCHEYFPFPTQSGGSANLRRLCRTLLLTGP